MNEPDYMVRVPENSGGPPCWGASEKSVDRNPRNTPPKKPERPIYKKANERSTLLAELKVRQLTFTTIEDAVDRHNVRKPKSPETGDWHQEEPEETESLSVVSEVTATFDSGLNRTAFQAVLGQLERQHKEISESTRQELRRAGSSSSSKRSSRATLSRWNSNGSMGDSRPSLPKSRRGDQVESSSSELASGGIPFTAVSSAPEGSSQDLTSKAEKDPSKQRNESQG